MLGFICLICIDIFFAILSIVGIKYLLSEKNYDCVKKSEFEKANDIFGAVIVFIMLAILFSFTYMIYCIEFN